jgi:isoleucyl-tRNA synthetase
MADEGETHEKSEVALREEAVLKFWQDNKIFEKSLTKDAPKGEFVFYDGPPFATGLPHYGHILAGTIKDAIPRYKTMQGYRVPRRWGWDCHGLPLENIIEKELGLATKRDIERIGVGAFNDAAKNAVLRYADDWRRIIPRTGRFVDMDNDYRTMDSTYTESVWWAFKTLHDKGLVYEGYKAMQLCPRCGTTLSNFEVAQGYKDITDISVTVKLELKDEPKTYLLAWTTTPWTLPGNMAAAVAGDQLYVRIKQGEEKYILAKARLSIIDGEYEIEKEFMGSELVGKSYTPPFDYFRTHKMEPAENAWKVYAAPFVTMEDGTGIVHIAPAFGAEDLELAEKENIPIVHHVSKDGLFIPAVTDFAGEHAKPKEDNQAGDVLIIKNLAPKGLIYKKEKLVHSYPHCWRCDTPLLNYASSSWFVEVTKFKDQLVSENKKVTWVPPEVGQKRFGNWLENARDWAISRARYWGAPIPVWRNPHTKELTIVGSLEDLKKHIKPAHNTYYTIRHGEAEHNLMDKPSYKADDPYHLTEKGKETVRASAEKLKGKGIDMLVVSPFIRTKETAAIVAEVLGIPESEMHTDARLGDINVGNFTSIKAYEEKFHVSPDTFYEHPEGGESLNDVRRRVGEVLYELEGKYKGKTILFVSHGDPISMLQGVARGLDPRHMYALSDFVYPEKGMPAPMQFVPLPHNSDYALDYHRPYIDEVVLHAADGTRLERVPDVFDCWFESGSMSYAQNHYPFEHKEVFDPNPGWFKKSRGYPADFIAEGLDQTRGWFYSLLVLGVGLFGRSPYKHVIVNGTVLAEDGQKMSKKLKNYPDPLEVINKFGADAVRYYMLSSPLLRGEDLNFSEKGVNEVASKLIGRFINVVSFYELYKNDVAETQNSSHVLDRWILSRLSETISAVEKGMDAYEIDRATRPLMDFVDDVSTWYLRRSRDRLKDGGADAAAALGTLHTVLETASKVMAPFMPFAAEYVYGRVRATDAPESVHLAEWPKAGVVDAKLTAEMTEVRKVVSLALEARQKANAKVRQPLALLTIQSQMLAGKNELLQLIAEEVNVKKVTVNMAMKEPILLDTTITDALREEGEWRDKVREIQEVRKQDGLKPQDKVILFAPEGTAKIIMANFEQTAKITNIVEVKIAETMYVTKA